MQFSTFNLNENIQKSLDENKYISTTQIQEKVIPLVLENKDLMAKAQTGSGKTAGFVLPILEKWLGYNHPKKAKITTLVLAPTRELTLQVANTFEIFSKNFNKKPKIVSVIGGASIGDQLLDIQKGCDIVVATAGRLLDIINKKQIDLSTLEFFVLDEADKMLDLGFSDELDEILKELPENRQNLLFSATYPQKMLDIASKITTSAVKVEQEEEAPTVEKIQQRAIRVNSENRGPLLRHLIQSNDWPLVLVFMANKRASDNIAAKFRKHGIEAESFHGDLIQEERVETLEDFKAKKINVLFATDIAARGLHINDITCVINFDLPRATADYVHRIGRTGRAGKDGLAISFITNENSEHFKLIEKRCKISLEKEVLEGFEPTGKAPVKQKGAEAVKGKRKSKKDKLREAQANKDK
ncbi:DEAD/DEAH box helicase [Poseidonibacter lekithochrous]|uniref:DEAD/DEAH box helicase n=1 Tax=Poseidonibacter lekithochrous TaxID=1904463 RepID=UPI0008FCD8F9|nr:DEAD/DEAH box helicase [Poseidonibacter lekithochrous]QKJ22782.1 DEAD-box ATP-dependent RNA helicase [Poseidonibacter lekithochrous]